MADDGTFKGHGGKPGRKATVISMSAHKSRHLVEGDKSSKKLTGLTVFDFESEPGDQLEEPQPARAANTTSGKAKPATAANSLLQSGSEPVSQPVAPPAAASVGSEAGQSDALPCENTPFEHNSGLGEESKPAPARRFLRWGLEDGGVSTDLTVRDLFQDVEAGDLDDNESYRKDRFDQKIERWQHKASRSESVFESFYHAFHGLKVGFAGQRNVRIHCCIAITVFILALAVRVDAVSWLALILASGFVFFAEFLNTAVEHVTDIQADFRYHPSARFAKDTAAAAVLVAAMTAVLVGIVVFGPHVLALLSLLPGTGP